MSAHDLAVALDIETDLITPVPRGAFDDRREHLTRYLAARLIVTAQGRPCRPAEPELSYERLPEDMVIVLRYECPAPVSRLGIRYGLFFDLDPTHRSLGRVELAGRSEPFVFDRSLAVLDVEAGGAGQAPPFVRLLRLGVEHILVGWDHLLFLLALLIGAQGLRSVIAIVSAFTLAHSLTLALAWYDVIAVPSRLVETAIAASIAWIALENLLERGAARRWLVAGGLGLVHGLGFYGALRAVGLEGAGVVTTLLAFNLGVEIGQVSLVALVWMPLAWWIRQGWHRPSARAGSAAILLAALWLVIQRALTG